MRIGHSPSSSSSSSCGDGCSRCSACRRVFVLCSRQFECVSVVCVFCMLPLSSHLKLSHHTSHRTRDRTSPRHRWSAKFVFFCSLPTPTQQRCLNVMRSVQYDKVLQDEHLEIVPTANYSHNFSKYLPPASKTWDTTNTVRGVALVDNETIVQTTNVGGDSVAPPKEVFKKIVDVESKKYNKKENEHDEWISISAPYLQQHVFRF